jgi:ABC-type glycerol-3-phosphate transport system substrate-binding protein
MMRRGSTAWWRRLGAAAMVLALALPTAGVVNAAHPRAGTTLKLWNDKATWKAWFNAEGQAAQKAVGVGWTAVPYADTTTYQAAVRTAARTSKAPDLYTWWSGWQMKDIVDAGLATDLSALWDKNKSAYSSDLRSAFTFNGKTYGMPLYLSYWEVIYNKHIFAKYNLTPPKTWAQFMAINKTLRSHGVTPLGATISGRWPGFIYFEELLARSDPKAYNDLMAGKIKYTDPTVVKAMNLWASMIKEGDFTDPAAVQFGTAGTNDLLQYFTKGKVAMVEIGSWYEPTIAGAGLKPGTDFGAFIMPDINPSAGNIVIFETGPLVVASRGSNRDQAMTAADYFMSKAGQQAWINATGFIPARNDVKATSPVDTAIVSTINSGRYTLLQRYWEATPFDIVNVAVDQFDKFMLHPNNPMSILQTIQTQADRTWASMH